MKYDDTLLLLKQARDAMWDVAHGEPVWNKTVRDLVAAIDEQLEQQADRQSEGEAHDAAQDAAGDVMTERLRQIYVEGWTPAHDDEHDDNSLARAAACYALGRMTLHPPLGPDSIIWPWEVAAWRPKDRRSDLVRAGALILAEIERLDRLAARQQEKPQGGCNG